MSGKTIATIYFYLISAASLALIVIGIFNAVNFFINITQYDKYPLRYSQGDCEGGFGYPMPYKMMPSDGREATPAAQDLDKQKQVCQKLQEQDSKQHKIEDVRNVITFTLVGLILFSIHFPLARKQSEG